MTYQQARPTTLYSITIEGTINEHKFDTGLISLHALHDLGKQISGQTDTMIYEKLLSTSGDDLDLGNCNWLFRGCRIFTFAKDFVPNYTLTAWLRFMGVPDNLLVDPIKKVPYIVGNAFFLPPLATGSFIKSQHYPFPEPLRIELSIFTKYWDATKLNPNSLAMQTLIHLSNFSRCFHCRMRVISNTKHCSGCARFTFCSEECLSKSHAFGHDQKFCACVKKITMDYDCEDEVTLYLLANMLRKDTVVTGFQTAKQLLEQRQVFK